MNDMQPQDLLIKGRKHLLLDEFEQAVDTFEEACKLISEKFGELADECAEPYFLYGKALLEYGRLDNNVLNEEPVDEEESESEDDSDSIKDKIDLANENINGDHELGIKTNGISECTNGNAKQNENDTDGTVNEESMAVSNFQLAWEVLDLSRIILSKKEDKESKIKLSETFMKLAEVSLEIENYDKAISDLIECLEIQKAHIDSNDRRIAETYYTLSLAYSLINNYDSAIKSLENAINIINNKIESLQQQCIPEKGHTDIGNKDACQDEIVELKNLLKDLTEKMNELKENLEKPIKSTLFNESDVKTETKSSTLSHTFINGNDILGLSSNKEVDDITHLVKRKKTE